MAYNNRFRFRFESVNGVEYNIYILKDGYSGTCEQRALGRGPMLKKKRNGPICGTSLELYAECATDGEFAELYTSDPKKFRADVYRGSNMIWTGFVSTELYSEPSIAPPYDVQIVATDGLGELKQVYFEAPGEISLKALFAQLLSFTGSDRGFYFATNLRHTGGTKSQMLNWTINVDFLDGETCYNVLTKLLESLHATITTYNGRWLIARETDIETLLNSSAGLAVISYSNGTVSTTTIGNVVKTLGQMGQADIHPWGNLSTTIEPARKSVVVAAPWYMRGYLEDPDMEENPPVHWVPGGYTEKITHDNGFYVGNNRSKVDTLYQDIPMEYLSSGLKFTVRAFGSNTTGNGHCELRLYAEWRVDGNNPIVGTERGWRSNSWEDVASIDLGEPQIWPNWQDYSITLKKLGATVPGTLRLVIQAKNVRVRYANLELVHEAGYEDTIHIDNGARGEADEVEIIGSRIPAEGLENKNFYQGFWKYSGEELITFEDSNHSNGDFLSIQALDRAVSVALARTKTQGLINIPSEASTMPLLVKQDSQNSWVETWEWDLREDEVTIQALSTPNAEIDIDSEEVVPMTGGGSSSGGSGGGSSSGSGTNLLSVWRSLTNNDDLDDYDSETKIAIEHLSTFLEVVEYTSGHYALKTKASVPFNGDVVDIDGFYSDGFVDSGGVSPGGGGGGGNVDMVEVWASLQNTATDTSRNAWKFSTAHLPTLGAGLAYTDNADSGASLATSLGIASTHYLPTAQEWAGVASNLEGLQAMQAQLDALASRDNFDELTATAFFADVAAVSALYAYSIELNGADLETTLSGKQATISDLSTIRSRADEGHTAYGWGNHANAGYFAASSFTAANIVSTLGTTAVNRATADAAGENIADNFTTVSKALQSLQAQLNSVATRSVLDELSVANLFTDTLAASKIFAETIDFGGYVLGVSGSVMQWNGSALFSTMSSSAGTNLSITVGGQNRTATLYATYDSASENISDKFGIVSTALQSLQKQIDSVAAAVGNSDEIYAGCASFDTLAVGSGIYAGSLLATGYVNSGASASSSDARLKSNIEEISAEKAVSLLMKLRGVEWDWNEKKACLEGRHGSGLVAQEVEKVMPWMVLDLNGELSLTYSSLWGVAIPVMQSHEERIAALERENEELKKQLNTITH